MYVFTEYRLCEVSYNEGFLKDVQKNNTMKLLTQDSIFVKMKCSDLATLECEYCKVSFTKQVKYVKQAIKGNKKIKCNFCSRKCSSSSQNTRINVLCTQCRKIFKKPKKRILENNFCSSSCSAIYSNKKRANIYYCKNCSTKLNHKKIYCSKICEHSFTYSDYIEKWKNGAVSGGENGKISNYLRKFMLEKSNNKCQICGFNTSHPLDGKPVLHIDHINGNWLDNSENNLRVLCPNCHSLTVNFGCRNIGSGRHRALKKSGYSHR